MRRLLWLALLLAPSALWAQPAGVCYVVRTDASCSTKGCSRTGEACVTGTSLCLCNTSSGLFDVCLSAGGATTFLALTDTPDSYTGQTLKVVRVNAGETGLEFAAAGAGDVTDVGPGCATGACLTDGLATTGTTLAVWEGNVADAEQVTFAMSSAEPAAAFTITYPDASGEVSLLGQTIGDAELASNYSGVGACGANTFASTLNDNAAPSCTQPDIDNLAGLTDVGAAITKTTADLVVSGVNVDFEAGGSEGYPRLAQSVTPPAGDCDAAGEAGRVYFDTDQPVNEKLFVCLGAGGWERVGGAGGGGFTSFNIDGDNNSPQTITDANEALIAGGAGIATTASATDTVTVATASSEENFLASGALTCGASTRGKMQVHTTPLQYCDNAATPALQYAAYATSAGEATIINLTANPTNCSAGNHADGISGTGAAECSADDDVPESGDFTNLTGGRSLTCASGTCDADAELYTQTKCINIDPTASTTDWFFFRVETAITVTGVDCIVDAATSVVMTLRECDANGGSCGATEAAITCAATNTTEVSGVDDNAVDATDWMRVLRGTVSGSPTQATLCMTYTVND